ncbi:MAG TPA: GDSL-type esterase/lipase family protein [Polyangia bacterium]|nr:GDSL-type esterase/lipase family protein [Polyangia bacterium]
MPILAVAALLIALCAAAASGCASCKGSDGTGCTTAVQGGGGDDRGTGSGGAGGADPVGAGGTSVGAGGTSVGAGGTSTGVGGAMGLGGTAGGVGVGGAGAGAGGSGDRDDGTVISAGVRWLGRVDTRTLDRPRFAWSGTGFIARFNGAGLTVTMSNAGAFSFKAVVDDQPQPAFAAVAGQGSYPVAAGLAAGTVHTVELYRQTEGVYGESQLIGITVQGGALLDPPRARPRRIEVFGASVSCGYGDLGLAPCGFTFATESHFDTYAAVAARTLGADLSVVAISGRGVIRNSDGTTAGNIPSLYDRVLPASATPAWDFHIRPQAVVINLGKNDLATGDPGVAFVNGYVAFVHTLRARYPDALIVAATGPNLGNANHALQLTYVQRALDTLHTEGDTRVDLLDWPEETPAETGCDVHPTAPKHRTMGQALATLLSTRVTW